MCRGKMFGKKSRISKVQGGHRAWRCVVASLAAVALWSLTRPLLTRIDFAFVSPGFLLNCARASLVRLHAASIIPRPIHGPSVMVRKPRFDMGHIADGAERPPGPIRSLYLNKTITATLEGGASPDGRGGLMGRYRDEIAEHLRARAELAARGQLPNITVLWDWDNVNLEEHKEERAYMVGPMKVLDRTLRWLAGMLDSTITRVETVEFTRDGAANEQKYRGGKIDFFTSLRQMGAVVHRAWPRITHAADYILLERMRTFLDDMQQGGPPRVICVVSHEEGYLPMMEAAQSEGATVVHFAPGSEYARYYPAGANFSIEIQTPVWWMVKRDIFAANWQLDPMRPAEEWTLAQGAPLWNWGSIDVQPAPEEELDRRVFHDFLSRQSFTPKPAKFTGLWSRPGVKLNDTFFGAVDKVLEKDLPRFFEKRSLQPIPADAHQILQRSVAALQQEEGATAAVYWNFEKLPLLPQGPAQQEMLARIVRWMEHYLQMPVARFEIARVTEPWERLGTDPFDWLFHAQQIGMITHRVWPPKDEATNFALTRGIAVLAEAALSGVAGLPRLVCIISDSVIFDDALERAQRAGIDVVFIGPQGGGLYYPAKSNFKTAIKTVKWDTAMGDLGECPRSPFIPGAGAPDQPHPVHYKNPIPVDTSWGKPSELRLEKTPWHLQPIGQAS